MAARIEAIVGVDNADCVRATVFAGDGVTWLYLYFDGGNTHHTRIAVHDLPADYMHRLAAAINAVPVETPAAAERRAA